MVSKTIALTLVIATFLAAPAAVTEFAFAQTENQLLDDPIGALVGSMIGTGVILGNIVLIIVVLMIVVLVAVFVIQFSANASRNISLANDNATAGLKDAVTGIFKKNGSSGSG